MSRRRNGDAGTTLAELAVSMFIGTIVLAAVATVFVGTLRSTRTANSRVTSAADARVAMETMTRGLRVGVDPPMAGTTSPFLSAAGSSVNFYASLTTPSATTDPPPTLIQYAYDSTRKCLLRTQTAAVGTSPNFTFTTGAKSSCLAYGTVNGDGSPLFTYYPSGTTTTPLPLVSGSVVAANLPTIDSVGIHLVLSDPATPAAPATVIQDRVSLVNMIYPGN